MNRFLGDLAGTLLSWFRVGAVRLKDVSGALSVRNDDDTADAPLIASAITLTGNPAAGKVLTSDANGLGSWQDASGEGGASTFLALSDTPDSYTSQSGKFVRVNAGASALEFADSTALYTEWDVDAPPENPSAYNDEMSTLDTNKWAFLQGDSSMLTADKGTLLSGGDNFKITQAAPSGDFTVVIKTSWGIKWANYNAPFSLGVTVNDGNENGTTYHFQAYAATTSNMQIYVQVRNNGAYSSNQGIIQQKFFPTLYFRIRRVDTTMWFEFSADGFAWWYIYSVTMATCGGFLLMNGPSASDPNAYARCHFFRVFPGMTAAHEPCHGRMMGRATFSL